MATLRDKIIDRVSIEDVYPKQLVRNRGHCVTHDNTSSPSFTYYPQTETWYCWSCSKGGTVVDLYAHIHNLSYRDALYELAKEYEIGVSEEEKKTIEKQSDIYEIFKFFCDICHENFLDSKLFESEKNKRGFTQETIEKFKIGLLDDSIIEQMQKKFDNQSLYDAGFLNDKLHWYVSYRIVYPYLNTKQEPIYFIYRLIEGSPDYNKNAKYVKHRKEYIHEPLFGLNSTNEFPDKPLIITEGITDAISVIQEQYPCISPVTIRFKGKDLRKIEKYARRFEKVVVINDNEENKQGLEGATETLSYLLKNGINAFINEIPKPLGKDKIDLDEYLRDEGKEKLKELCDQAIRGHEFFLSFINESSSKTDLISFFKLFPISNNLIREDYCKKVAKIRNISIVTIREINEESISLLETEYNQRSIGVRDDIFNIDTKKTTSLKVYDSLDYREGVIENRENGVFFIAYDNQGNSKEIRILDYPFHIIHKTKNLNTDLFSYEFNGKTYNTQSRSDMLIEFDEYRYEGDRGKDILKRLITTMADRIEYTDLETVLGFSNTSEWVLPQLQEERNYRILITTDFQKEVYKNCSDIIGKEYDLELIKEKIEHFLDITTMKKGKVAMIVGWAMATMFRLVFLEYFDFAPDLLLIGDPQTGKTAFSKAILINMIGAWKRMLQGSEISTKARFEDVCSTSTFPVLVDELEYVNYDVIDVMKARSTYISQYTRKTSARKMFSKPEVAGLCITTNETPKSFYNTALIERLIVINFPSDEVIFENQEWNDLSRELKKLNIFSAIYDFTKKEKFDDGFIEEIYSIIRIIQKACREFTYDARLRKKFIFVLFGLMIFNLIFDIDLTSDLEIIHFEKSGRIITGDLLNDFINFCSIAIEYDIGTTSQQGTPIRGDNPKFLTKPLEANRTGDYIFAPVNLRDFKEFTGDRNLKMVNLTSKLNKAIGKKDYFSYGQWSISGDKNWCMKIPKEFRKEIAEFRKDD